jgi:signal transduction histidine kinase
MTGTRRSLAVACAVLAVAGAATAAMTARTDEVPAAFLVGGVVVLYAGVGLVIALARPGHRVGLALLGGAAMWGVGEGTLALGVQGLVAEPGSVAGAPWLALTGTVLRGAGWLVLVLVVPLLFPDGRAPLRPWRWAAPTAAAALVAFVATSLLASAPIDDRLADVPNPLRPPAVLSEAVEVLALVALALAAVALVGAVGGLVSRWRSGAPLVRQQLIWFTWAAAVPVAFVPLIATGGAGAAAFGAAVLPLPVAIGFAVLQHRLYDVQFAINRTVAWAALSLSLAAVYVLVVAGVGALLDARGASWLPWVATGLVALSVAPLRDAGQRAANRLTYGQWGQPEAVLAGVRRRLADATDVHALLEDLVRELGEGLELGRIVVLDADGTEVAAHGSGTVPDVETPLTAYGRTVGLLRWSSPRRVLRETDRRLLDDIAAQLGTLVHAASLVAGLRAAQERLVLAREDERRRLRRDLHDGLGSRLAGLTFITEAAGNLLRSDVREAEAALQQVRAGIQAAVLDVRRVVDGLTPASLDQLGLVGAVMELADRLGRELPAGIAVDAPADLPPLNAAVEVAAYRVVQESLTNVVRHAGASGGRVRLRHDGSALVLEVSDDGCGTVAPRPGGAGLRGMRERAEELGGELSVDGRPGCGTTVRVRLPAAGFAPGSGAGPAARAAVEVAVR